MSRHVTAKFDADADADFADEYNLRLNLGMFNIICIVIYIIKVIVMFIIIIVLFINTITMMTKIMGRWAPGKCWQVFL